MTRSLLAPSLAFAVALGFFVSFAQLVTARLARDVHGLGPLAAEVVTAAFFGAGLAGCLAAGAALDRRSDRRPPRAALVVGALGMAAAAAAAGQAPTLAGYLAAVLVAGGLLGAVVPGLFLLLRAGAAPGEIGAAFGVVTAVTYTVANGFELWRHQPAAACTLLAALGAAGAAAVLASPAAGHEEAWEATPEPEVGNLALLGAVVAADAFGFAVVMHGELAAFTFQGAAHLGANALFHAAGALLGVWAYTPRRAGPVLAASLAPMGLAHLAFWALGPGHGPGFLWTLLNGAGVAAYHVPFFAALAYGGGPDLGRRFARRLCLVGWICAGVGLGAGRLALLVAEPASLLPVAGLACLGAAALVGKGWDPRGFGAS